MLNNSPSHGYSDYAMNLLILLIELRLILAELGNFIVYHMEV